MNNQLRDINNLYSAYLDALKKFGFKGDVSGNYSDRILAATDNSIYQILPQAVVYPVSHHDIKRLFELANQEKFKSIKFSLRGAGTGTNGQSLSVGVIVDCSRWMTKILEINLAENWVSVEPGVVLDQLNDYLKLYGVCLPIRIAPSDRATIGGMVNTDASGVGSCCYGKTSDHVVELKYILPNASESVSDQMMQAMRDLILKNTDKIEKVFPKLGNRCMTGYNLAKAYNSEHNQFDLNYLLSGSEGTLAAITEIKLKLTPLPTAKTLFVLKVKNFNDALVLSQKLRKFKPTVIEVVDENVISLAKKDIVYQSVKGLLGDVSALVYVEFYSQTDSLLTALFLDSICDGYYKATNEQEIQALWQIRKKGVGLLANMSGNRKPIAFIEDTIVPPENLPQYAKALIDLIESYGLDYGVYGHADAGCLHVRPALDAKSSKDEKIIYELTDKVAALVKKHHGILWGEHGRGFRSVYGKDFFGEALFSVLQKIKCLFDPNNRLNPGKVATPDESHSLVSIKSPLRGHFDKQINLKSQAKFQKALACNGNAACLNYKADSAICPSYKVTKDQKHSPRGRSNLFREWLRQGEYVKGDFSKALFDAMSGCLECKACSAYCPVHVDVPTLKAHFLESYYKKHWRSPQAYLLAHLEQAVPMLAKAKTIYNAARHFSFLVGLHDLPAMSSINIDKHLDIQHTKAKKTVVLLKDVLTTYFEPELYLACCNLLKKMNVNVISLPYFPSGKLLFAKGYLDKFKKVANKNALLLSAYKNIDIIGIEPSITLCFRDEYQLVLPKGKCPSVKLIQEWLSDNVCLNDLVPVKKDPKKYYLLSHCMEKSVRVNSENLWLNVFEAFNLELDILTAGCCGMAGTYGHEASYMSHSKKLFDLSWAEKVKKHEPDLLVTGFSCRQQVRRILGESVSHPLVVLLNLLI